MKPTLVYLCYHFPKISETFVLNEIRFLSREYRIEVCALDRPDEPIDYDRNLVSKVHYFGRAFRDKHQLIGWVTAVTGMMFRRPLRCLESLRLVPDFRHYPLWLAACWFARHYIHAGPIRLHATFSAEAATMASVMAKLLNRPYSVTDQAQDYVGKKSGIFHHLQNAALIIASCRYIKDKLLRINPAVSPGKIKVIYSGIDPVQFAFRHTIPPITPFNLLTVTRLIDTKGIEDVIRALPGIIRHCTDVIYRIVGDGPLRVYLENLTRSMKLDSRVQFLGAVPNHRLPLLYAQAHVFLLPCVITPRRIEDSLPLVIGEAMSVGLPVVTTAVGGIAELVVDGENGYLVPQHSPRAITDTVNRIYDAYHGLTPLILNARHSVEQNYNVMTEKIRLLELFRRLDHTGHNRDRSVFPSGKELGCPGRS